MSGKLCLHNHLFLFFSDSNQHPFYSLKLSHGAPAELRVYHHRDHHICYRGGKKGTCVNAR